MTEILLYSALFLSIGFGSYLLFAMPLLQEQQKKKRVMEVVNKKRRTLLEASKKTQKIKDNNSAKDTIAALFKMQKIAGEMGQKLRDKCLQAGYRSPSAPLVFLCLRILLPIAFSLFTMTVLTLSGSSGPDPLPGHSGVRWGSYIILGAAIFGFYLPNILLKNQMMKRQQEIALSFPDALDMILICVQGGIGIEQAIDRIAKEIAEHSKVLAEELGILSAELSMLNERRKAFQDFATRVGSGSARSFATAMIQAEQYGTSISTAMRVLAEDQRDQRMAEAERKAASLPPKLTVPMILFFLPSLFIAILGPAAIQAMLMH